MNSLIEMYNEIFGKLKSISDQIHKIENEITDLRERRESDDNGPARMKRLEEQLVKIDEYLLVIKELQKVAKRNLESQNVLTINTPPGYRVNLNRLKKWASMIDPASSNDPYAQRVLAVAKCDERFLEQKRKEFNELLAQLKAKGGDVVGEKIDEIEAKIHNLKLEIKFLLESQSIFRFAERVIKENEQFCYAVSPTQYKNGESVLKEFAPGSYGMPMPLDSTYREWFEEQFGRFYDAEGNRVLLPAVMPLDEEFMMTISCAPSREKLLDKGVQNMLLNIIDNSAVGLQKIYIIDGLRFNTSAVGSLRQLEDTFALAKIPRNQEQITETLEKILFSFADIDDKLGDCDSVRLYNATIAAEDSEKIPLITLVVCGWPEVYDEYCKELLHKIMTNYTRYGISFVVVSYEHDEEELQDFLPDYAAHNVVNIRMNEDVTAVCTRGDEATNFVWYTLDTELAAAYADSIKVHTVEEMLPDCEYVSRCSFEGCPQYEKGKKDVSLPIGVDGQNQLQELAFGEDGAAAYLTGAVDSGRTQFLHTLITSVIRDYHPDDVELWLADFEMSEFMQYTNPCPPHVKYLLMDDVPELVYDFLDRLATVMKERQKFLEENPDLEKIEDCVETYMPVIVVVVEGFQTMAQMISDSDTYKQKLQELLENGSILGMRFMFSSQNFTDGCAALSAGALEAIQTRIAMKNNYSEISNTLALPADTELNRMKTWMGVIPEKYALVKYKDAEQVKVKRVNTLYFKGRGKGAYEPQQAFIKQLNERMNAVEEYNSKNADSYVYKEPVVIVGNSYEAFDKCAIEERVKALSESGAYNGDEVLVYVGTPRLVERYKEFALAPEARENILLLCNSGENDCGTAVVTSVMKCFEMQNRKVVVWGGDRNKVLKNACETVWKDYEVITDAEEICMQIRKLKEEIQSDSIEEGTLVVLLGIEDMDAVLNAIYFEEEEALEEVQSEEELVEVVSEEKLPEDELPEEEVLEEEVLEEEVLEEIVEDVQEVLSYSVKEDLLYVVQQGGKKGVHVLMYLNAYKDLRTIGLEEEAFRHRLAFAISGEDSKSVFGDEVIGTLPEHVCVYGDTLEHFGFRPYLHQGISWDGWSVDENGKVIKK